MITEHSLLQPDGDTCAHCGAERSPTWITPPNNPNESRVFCSEACIRYSRQFRGIREKRAVERVLADPNDDRLSSEL